MHGTDQAVRRRIFVIACDTGRRYVIYNASEINNPFDHRPDGWYFRPYPVPVGLDVGESFDSADDAEHAARDHDVAGVEAMSATAAGA